MSAVFVGDVAKQHDKTHLTELPDGQIHNLVPKEDPLSFLWMREDPGIEVVKCTVCVHFPPKLSKPNEDLSQIVNSLLRSQTHPKDRKDLFTPYTSYFVAIAFVSLLTNGNQT